MPTKPQKGCQVPENEKNSKLNMFPHSGTGFGFKIAQKLRKK